MDNRNELERRMRNAIVTYSMKEGIVEICSDVAIQYTIDVLDVLRENEWKNLDNPHFMPHREMDNKIKELQSLLKPKS